MSGPNEHRARGGRCNRFNRNQQPARNESKHDRPSETSSTRLDCAAKP